MPVSSNGWVLVTGGAGRVGRATVSELKRRGHRVRSFDRVEAPDADENVIGDLAQPEALRRAMQGATALVHLAATPDDDDVLVRIIPDNVVGLFHTLEAARETGVRRVVLASSGQVNWWQNVAGGPFPTTLAHPVSPKYWYAATKMMLESVGRSYAEMHSQSVIVARLGWCPRTKEQVAEIAASHWAQDVFLSPGDAGRFFAAAVEAPRELKYEIVYATSKPLYELRYDLEPAQRLLGWSPQESWPAGIEVVPGGLDVLKK